MKKTIIISLSIALLLGIGVALAMRSASRNDNVLTPTDNAPEYQPGVGKVNPDGTVLEETDDKDRAPEDTPPTNSPTNQPKDVAVTLSRATVEGGLVTVTGYAETVKPGTCRLGFTKAGQKALSYTNPAELEVNNVSCNPFRIEKSDFPVGGSWKAIIVFTAPGLSGTSNEWTVEL